MLIEIYIFHKWVSEKQDYAEIYDDREKWNKWFSLIIYIVNGLH